MGAPADHFFHHTSETLRAWFESRGLAPFRAGQVLDWVYRKGVVDPARMTNLGRPEREALAAEMVFLSGATVRRQTATDGTRKLLVEWGDFGGGAARDGVGLELHPSQRVGHPERQTECVMIPSGGKSDGRGRATGVRRTACISSQVGCPVGCRFCASGLGGLDGNLTAGRIVEQVWRLGWERDEGEGGEAPAGGEGQGEDAPAGGKGKGEEAPAGSRCHGGETPAGSRCHVTNVVFMGMGEPLANFGSVVHAVRTIAAPWGLGISARRITVSTVGMPRAIERLAEQLEVPVTLALSLHAPNDALRRELIPWAEYTTIPELLAACQSWFRKTGREITLEYILLGGVNDRPEHAQQLAGVAKSLRANVNLIRYNEVEPLKFRRPRTEDVLEFQHVLRARGVNTHIRASRGRDIAAACGQLRHEAAGGPG